MIEREQIAALAREVDEVQAENDRLRARVAELESAMQSADRLAAEYARQTRDALERLRIVREERDQWFAASVNAESRVAELEAGLSPFAFAARHIYENYPDNTQMELALKAFRVILTAGDFRRAAELIAGKDGAE